MAEVDPGDDTIERWIVLWYRYDPARHERRNVAVTAYDNESDFKAAVARLEAQLHDLKAEGRAEPVEYIFGSVHSAGSEAESRERRIGYRLFQQARSQDLT
jgi:hypothetical protein